MLLDFRTDEAGSDIRCDVCIIGAGAAGITLANSLIDSGIQVCLLEGGGLEFTQESQSLYEGETVSLENPGPTSCRLRYFGGTTNHWAGWCAPLKDSDFEFRPWVAGSGWPIRGDELAPYYTKAQEICQVGTYGYDPAAYKDANHQFPSFDPDKASLGFFRFSPPTRFGQVYREQLRRADNIKVLLHANVIRLETDESASAVRKVPIRTIEGKNGSVRARIVVLACGGMENARVLLLSNQVEHTGLGNSSDLVGRYFMQHIERDVARVLATRPEVLGNFAKYRNRSVDVMPEISIADRAQEQYRILGSGFTFKRGGVAGTGYKALRRIWRDAREGHWPENLSDRLWAVLNDLDSVTSANPEKDHSIIRLYIRAETAPNRDSRISLGDKLDPFGLPQIKVDWRLTALDKRSIVASTHRIAEELGRLGLGRLELEDWLQQDADTWPQPLWGGCHHMGTTRMSSDVSSGVVNGNCRMHTVGNLYIAGSSVFPTSGYVQPTLTIVALALRLGDHLKERLGETKLT